MAKEAGVSEGDHIIYYLKEETGEVVIKKG